MSGVVQSQESVKLYEYDNVKPDLNEEFLEHHGILGQRWGHRNGPPYPLNDSVSTGKRLKGSGSGKISRRKKRKLQKKRVEAAKKARATRAANQQIKKTKEEILRTKDIVSMYKHIDQFTNKEIEDTLTRLRKENELKEAVEKLQNSQTPAAKKILGFATKNIGKGLREGTGDILSTVTRNAVKKGVRTGISNALGPEVANELLPVGGGGKKNKKKRR